MAAFAPPVHRDKFLYSSILYVDAGNDNHHPRASVAELTAILRPEAPKGKKTKTPDVTEPVKDPAWHFWTAQLLHYGLTSTKDKNVAKVRLLSALNGDRLEVPGWIRKLEVDLKKEWEAENRKIKKAAKEGGMPKSAAARGMVTKEVGAKKAMATKSLSASAKQDTPTKKEPTRKPATEDAKVTVPKPTSASSATSKATPVKRKRDDIEQPAQTASSKKTRSTVKPEVRTATISKVKSAPEKSSTTDDEPWPTPSRIIVPHNGWKYFDPDHCASTRPTTAPYPGAYRISCPDIECEWSGESIDEFYLAFSTTPNEWWSRFRWGAFKGILILQRDPKRANRTVGIPFKWRAHCAPSNEDRDGVGQIFFTSASTFRGQFFNFFRDKPCDFRGESMEYLLRSKQGNLMFTADQLAGKTPVLDQMRVEWGQMPTAMLDAPAKQPRAKKTKPTEPTPNRPLATRINEGLEDEPLRGGENDVYLSGTYKISSSGMEQDFGIPNTKFPFRLTLFTDEKAGMWWATFHWAHLDGIMKIDPGPTYETINDVHALDWRVENTETGQLTFGRGCHGQIWFDGDERMLAGKLFDLPGTEGDMDFEGLRLPGPRRIGGLKERWNWFVKAAYGRF